LPVSQPHPPLSPPPQPCLCLPVSVHADTCRSTLKPPPPPPPPPPLPSPYRSPSSASMWSLCWRGHAATSCGAASGHRSDCTLQPHSQRALQRSLPGGQNLRKRRKVAVDLPYWLNIHDPSCDIPTAQGPQRKRSHQRQAGTTCRHERPTAEERDAGAETWRCRWSEQGGMTTTMCTLGFPMGGMQQCSSRAYLAGL
jgi:hypothetical protein